MKNATAANTSLMNSTGSSRIVPSKVEGIALCSAFTLTSIFIVLGNLLIIILFAIDKKLRKKSLFLVINMTFADLMLGALSLPIYIYYIGTGFELWAGRYNMQSLHIVFTIVDSIFMTASLIFAVFISGERFYAVYWPFKHRTLSTRAYRNVVVMAWTLVLLATGLNNGLLWFVSSEFAIYQWISFLGALIVIMFGCNIAIWRKFQDKSVASQQPNRALQNKRLTKTLLFVSIFSLLSWLPLSIITYFISVSNVQIPVRFHNLTVCFAFSNSFINPLVYALRIPEFRQVLPSCCFRRQEATNMDGTEGRNNAARTLPTGPSHPQPEFEQVMDTKL